MPLVPPSLFGRSTRIAQGNCVGNVPDAHTCWTSHTNCSHRDRSGFISHSAITSQLLRGDDGRDVREADACLEKTQGSLHCLAATILPPGADKDQCQVGRPGLDVDEEDAVYESL